jgi:NADPH oxidase
MAGGGSVWRGFFTPQKLAFNFFFWGFHWAIFGIGWYVVATFAPAQRLTSHRWKQAIEPRLAPLNALQFSVWSSRGAGLVLSVDTMVIVMPMCRNLLRMIRPKIRFLPLDESMWFHRQVAYAMLFFTVIHVGAHYVKYVSPRR